MIDIKVKDKKRILIWFQLTMVIPLFLIISGCVVGSNPIPPLPFSYQPAQPNITLKVKTEEAWNAVLKRITELHGTIISFNDNLQFVTFKYDLAIPLYVNSFRNFPVFTRLIKEGDDPVSAYINKMLSNETYDLLRNYNALNDPSENLQLSLLQDVNHILHAKSIYDGLGVNSSVLDKMKIIDIKKTSEIDPHQNRLILQYVYKDLFYPNSILDQAESNSYVYSTIVVIPTLNEDNAIVMISSWQDSFPVTGNFDRFYLNGL